MSFDEFGPENYFELYSGADTVASNFRNITSKHVLALLRLSGYDPSLFQKYKKVLKERLFDCGTLLKNRALVDLLKVYYPTITTVDELHHDDDDDDDDDDTHTYRLDIGLGQLLLL